MDPDISFPGGWTAPLELTGALPRKPHLSDDGRGLAIVATVFLLAASAWVLWASIRAVKQTAQTAALRREGLHAAGEVKRRWNVGRSLTPWVRYAFTANGVAFTGESRVPDHFLGGLREAGPLPIRFLPSNPAINHPADWEESAFSAWSMLIVAAAPAVLGIMVWASLRGDRQLLIAGVPTAGVITKCSPGSRGGWSVDYQLRTADGSVAKGASGATSRLDAGASICVLYLPRNPRRNRPYPMANYRVAQ
jgi:hypothetical protein